MSEGVRTAKEGANESVGLEQERSDLRHDLGITMDKRGELALAVGTGLLGVFILVASRNIRAGLLHDPITSRGLPIMTGILLIIGGIALTVRQLLTWSVLPGNLVPEEGQTDEEGYPASWVRAFGIILVSFIWQWLLKPAGFLIATPFYLAASSWIMGVKSWVKIIGFSIIFTLLVWAIFHPLLYIKLPLGPLEDWAGSWRFFP
jgi:hypothetical protein